MVEAEFVLAGLSGIIKAWTLENMIAEGDSLKLMLTQEETFALEPHRYDAQLRVKTTDGKVMATRKMHLYVEDLISEVIL